jgi:hypothetical protein
MRTMRERLQRVENELRFRAWLGRERMIEAMTIEELMTYQATGRWPDRSEPAPGSCSLDAMDRESVRKLFEKERKRYDAHNAHEVELLDPWTLARERL